MKKTFVSYLPTRLLFALSLPLLTLSCADSPKAVEEVPTSAVPSEPGGGGATAPEKVLPTSLEDAINSAFRTPQNKERDVYRHPLETLQFFGLQPSMRVVEINPGKGWYSEILAPYLSNSGEFIAALPSGESEYMKKAEQQYRDWLAQNPEIKATVVPLAMKGAISTGEPVDMILTFRNVHNWMSNDQAQDAFKTFYATLKPGGILGVVEHRGNAKKKQDPKAKSGYVRESDVIRMATQAGFKLEAKSEINANPKDTKDYADGVWTLPPTLKKGETDKEKYLAIGESDRMTLKFIKPLSGGKKNKK